MRTRLVLPVVLLLGLFLPSAISAQPMDYASVGIDPSYQEAAPGAQLAFTVSGSSTQGGTVSVSIEAGLTLAGNPTCYSSCRGPFVSERSDATTVEVTLDGQVATFGLTVAVSPSANVGDTLNINVILVGGPQALEMSSATVLVTAAAPTTESGSGGLPDTRQAYLSVYPEAARVTPSGDVLYFIQPIFWGQWEEDFPAYSVEVRISMGMSPLFEPFCGERSSTIPMQIPCAATIQENSDGSTTISTSPGYSAGDTNGIYLILKTDSGLEPDLSLSLSFNMTVPESTGIGQPDSVRSNVIVVDESSLMTPQSTGAVSGVMEIASGGYSVNGSSCASVGPDPWPQLELYEFGNPTLLATTNETTGIMGNATDGSNERSCYVSFSFENVASSHSIYLVARGPSYGGSPCRSCVIGLITSSKYADEVFVDHTQPPNP